MKEAFSDTDLEEKRRRAIKPESHSSCPREVDFSIKIPLFIYLFIFKFTPMDLEFHRQSKESAYHKVYLE